MDIILDSISTVAFCGVIFGLVWIQRKFFEILIQRFYPKLLDNTRLISKLYGEIFIPSTPLAVGGVLSFMYQSYPFPEIFSSSVEGRVFYGIFCGLISGWVYKIVKGFLKQKLKSLGVSDSVPPKSIV